MAIDFAIIPALPLIAFLILALWGDKLYRKVAAFIGVGFTAIAALITIIDGVQYISRILPSGGMASSRLWQWFSTDSFISEVALRLDPLSLVFCFVITFVGFLILLYSVEFMSDDEGFSRFFAYMNLFICSMLILVLADNLLLLYLGWEGVGLCSYLLIGFWYKDPANTAAANKAFIITRIGDTAMIIGLFMLVLNFNTLKIQDILDQIPTQWAKGSPMVVITALLLLGGAIGKSAQFPLQTWLPDAMAGPSPVSALIHAATMVTAGVYLIARTHVLFEFAPVVQILVAVIGAVTLLIAGFSALTQHDLKRILAYSTISQIGYMFLALGVGAWQAGIFHFMIHAFFKALLFLAGGAVILLLHEEHDIYKMGGLKKLMPVIFFTFFAGSASLSALPLVTAGFYSKDQILWYSFSASNGNTWLWVAGIVGAFITALYSFRLVFVAFYGEAKILPSRSAGNLIKIPLVILAVLSIIGGFIEFSLPFGHVHLFSSFLSKILPGTVLIKQESSEPIFQIISAIVSLSGLYLAYLFFLKRIPLAEKFSNERLAHFFYRGWDFDWLYDHLIVRPFTWMAVINKGDFMDYFNKGIAGLTVLFNRSLVVTQNGKLRFYIMGITIGIALILTYMITK
jgi:NADH-quinone oxidoreductase subunit L